ncbi:DUF4352 domain-containing protein [Protaetiibacter larvae]|uniref:DUF4352 domain-containing protein n=1 Tax=Protaetiibacter larvae TaxID=2592654 RepID=A0A5C1YB22_9MICO|nr:DUF4352 domain-containing protein [Protaetiibacter larvae]QEO10628.1 DUF4352 domain-containing protein [Protaetiibacter larvae]
MTIPPPPVGQPAPQPEPAAPHAPVATAAPTPSGSKVLPILAIVFAGIALLTAFVLPVITWIPAVAAIVLSIIALVKRHKPAGLSIAAIIVAPLAWIIAIIVAIAGIAAGVGDALDGDKPSVQLPSDEGGEDAAPEESDAGTRDNPLPLGSTIEGRDWTVVVNSVTFGATDAVLAENQFNEAPAEGSEFILINITATYTGDDADGQLAAFVGVEYVTPQGNTIDGLDALVVAPGALDTMSTVYNGASVTGNIALAVPTADGTSGVLAVRPGMLSDKVFVAVS